MWRTMKKEIWLPWQMALREIRTCIRSRVLRVLAVGSLLAGLGLYSMDPVLEEVTYLVMQVFLFGVPLMGTLMGTQAMQEDRGERPVLFSNSIAPRHYVGGTFLGQGLQIILFLVLFMLPVIVLHRAEGFLFVQLFMGIGLGLLFLSLGMACGESTRSQIRGFVHAIGAWLVFLFGFYGLARLAAGLEWFQTHPEAWTYLVLINPLEAFRLTVEAYNDQVLVSNPGELGIGFEWFLSFPAPATLLLTLFWMVPALLLAGWFLGRSEF